MMDILGSSTWNSNVDEKKKKNDSKQKLFE